MSVVLFALPKSYSFSKLTYENAKRESGLARDFLVNYSAFYSDLKDEELVSGAYSKIRNALFAFMLEETIPVWTKGYFSKEGFEDPMQDAFNLEAGPMGDVAFKASDVLTVAYKLLSEGQISYEEIDLSKLKARLEDHADDHSFMQSHYQNIIKPNPTMLKRVGRLIQSIG